MRVEVVFGNAGGEDGFFRAVDQRLFGRRRSLLPCMGAAERQRAKNRQQKKKEEDTLALFLSSPNAVSRYGRASTLIKNLKLPVC